ncbi:MAG: ABC transporter ATP-binding protein, partial [Clostridia bacterium]|nr:ABC transporter ATP-binding protein [Clostridia bacterium]
VRILEILAEVLIPYFNLWLSAEIVTALYEGRERREVWLLVVIALLGNLLLAVGKAAMNRAAYLEWTKLRNAEKAAFIQKALTLDYQKMENPEIHALRMGILHDSWINANGTEKMRGQIERIVRNGIHVLISLLFFADMMRNLVKGGIGLPAVLLLSGILLSVAASVALSRRYAAKQSLYWEDAMKAMLWENSISMGTMTNGMDCRLYRQTGLLKKIWDKTNRSHLAIIREAFRREAWGAVPIYAAGAASELFSYLLVLYHAVTGVFPVGGVIKYVGYLTNFTGSVGELFFAVDDLRTDVPYLENYLAYFDLPDETYQGSLPVEKRSDRKFEISFRDVSFRYAGAGEDALKHVSIDLKVGEKLAVVGPNGSGKTTFVKLLTRLYDPGEGEVVMNGFNVKKYDNREYLGLFSVVFQDFKLLALPLGNNVAAAETWDGEKAERYLEEVGFGERYRELPKGLETPLYKNFDEDGVLISGGEAQKIALARALYRDAPVVVLDEPTAALDPIAEARL